MKSEHDTLCINTIRILAADMVQKANSGHPGAPMGCAPLAHVLFSKHLGLFGGNPGWMARDRFLLSNGHACALQYVMLYLCGFPMSLEDLKAFRQLDSNTPGHPENIQTPGIEVTTGPLGQGIANAVGLAIAQRNIQATFTRPGFENLLSNWTIVLAGDGCLQEGIAAEALSLAGHLRLEKLIVIYDDNKITIDGDTELAFSEDVCARMLSYGFQVFEIEDGNEDIERINQIILQAKASRGKPSFIRLRTTIGFGSAMQGSEKVHGAPLGPAGLRAIKEQWGFNPEESFAIPQEVSSFYAEVIQQNAKRYAEWQELWKGYCKEHKSLAEELTRRMEKRTEILPITFPSYSPKDKAIATRKSSENALNSIAPVLNELIGGSADLTTSNLTRWSAAIDFQAEHPEGRYIRFGVREHAMAGVCNGIAAYGGFIPFCATFLNFIGYAQGAVRLSALSCFQVLYIMTHDSIGLGEDGPTHQPIEILPLLRATPNMLVLRPADGTEVNAAYEAALNHKNGPSVLCLSRQNLPHLSGTQREGFMKGAYVIEIMRSFELSASTLHLILTGSGSEVHICLEAGSRLSKELKINVSIVSFPSFELFERQPLEYKKTVFPQNVPVVSLEASSTFGWERYAHYSLGMQTFGASGPFEQVYQKFGLTVENLVEKSKRLLEFYSKKKPEWLVDRPTF